MRQSLFVLNIHNILKAFDSQIAIFLLNFAHPQAGLGFLFDRKNLCLEEKQEILK